jgi:CBS-domain-containing membrane protein
MPAMPAPPAYLASLLATILVPALGGTLGIAGMIALADLAELPLMLAPFTTSIVLVMAAPESAFAQPRNVIGGHVVAALSGLLVVATLGDSPWYAAAAVGLAIAAMQATGTMHPPAGINALIMVVAHPSWTFLFVPVAAGATCLVLFSLAYNGAIEALAARKAVKAKAARPPPVEAG